MRVAQAESQLGRLNDAVDGHRIVGVGHRQPVGDAEDCQRNQPLGRRREVPQFPVLMLKPERQRAAGAMLLQIAEGHGQSILSHTAGQMLRQRPAIEAVQSFLA